MRSIDAFFGPITPRVQSWTDFHQYGTILLSQHYIFSGHKQIQSFDEESIVAFLGDEAKTAAKVLFPKHDVNSWRELKDKIYWDMARRRFAPFATKTQSAGTLEMFTEEIREVVPTLLLPNENDFMNWVLRRMS